jgi:hypothetical protein
VTVRAKTSQSYLIRLGLISLFCFGLGLWFLFDGLITYPNQQVRALKYLELKEADRLDEWNALATQQGWPLKDPERPKTQGDIYFQLVLAGVLLPPAVIYAFLFLQYRGRWIELNDEGIVTSWGQDLRFEEITQLNKKKWQNKGIARVRYQREDRTRTVVLDDWKYEPKPTEAILRHVESGLDAEQIIGNPPKPVADESKSKA